MMDPCAHCEEMMQPYLDHVLTDEEMVRAEAHLDECEQCRRRYKFEESLRIYVRKAGVFDPAHNANGHRRTLLIGVMCVLGYQRADERTRAASR